MSAVAIDLPPVAAPSRQRPFLVADLFCGAGGFSTGAVRAIEATGRRVDLVCVNHWARAIETHSANHPAARHFVQDLAAVRPHLLVPEGRLDLLTASPTCTFHSRARGGKPTSDQQRADPWHVVTWLTELRVARMLIENVPEFVDWGPVDTRTGRPIRSRRGEYFRAWCAAMQALGIKLDWRIINCADYGDATTRRRFFLIGRSDRKTLGWAPPSHSRSGASTLFGARQPWRPARDIIDWSIRGQSIYTRKRPLAPATLRRIHAGIVRFQWPEPYIVVLRHHMAARSIDLPLPTITTGGHFGLVEPFLLSQASGGAARPVADPVPTIATDGAHALISPYYGSGSGETCKPVDRPLDTVTARSRFGLVMPITHSDRTNRSRDLDEPLPTITTANRGELAFIAASFGERPGQGSRTHSLAEPVPTILAQGRITFVEPAAPPEYDILFRMLQPPELAAAMGFAGYKFRGTKTEITAQIGNAVPVKTATALVAALVTE